MDTIGIIGQGFVGTAVREGFRNHFTIETYDKFKSEASTCDTLAELCGKAHVVFVCLPTPMRRDGSCDLSIVQQTVRNIDAQQLNNVAVIKSTVPPGTTGALNEECKNIQVVFNPEFLTEANYIDDFKNQNRIIIGGPRPASTTVKNLFKKAFYSTPIIKTGSSTAEMVKYFINAFLATKVSFANEIYKICEKTDIDYDKVVEYALYDDRIGKSHLTVPGPDDEFGFGGHCLPKDLNALISVAVENSLGLYINVLSGVLETNDKVRKNRDWEDMKGRAVVDD